MVGPVPLTGSEPPAAVQADLRRLRVLARFGHVSADLHPAPLLRLFLDEARLADVFAEAGSTHWRLAEQTPFNLILEAPA
jgi:hypothetical protein